MFFSSLDDNFCIFLHEHIHKTLELSCYTSEETIPRNFDWDLMNLQKKNHEFKKGGKILDLIFWFFGDFSQNTELSFEPCGFSSELAFLGYLCKISDL